MPSFRVFENCELAFFARHTVELSTVAENAVFAERKRIVNTVFSLDDSLYGKSELLSKHEIALIVCGNAHNRARAVACDNVVGNQNRHFFTVDGVDCVRARRNAGFLSG